MQYYLCIHFTALFLDPVPTERVLKPVNICWCTLWLFHHKTTRRCHAPQHPGFCRVQNGHFFLMLWSPSVSVFANVQREGACLYRRWCGLCVWRGGGMASMYWCTELEMEVYKGAGKKPLLCPLKIMKTVRREVKSDHCKTETAPR